MTLLKNELVCLFNGIRHSKAGRVLRIGAKDDDWSDYRLTLGKDRESDQVQSDGHTAADKL